MKIRFNNTTNAGFSLLELLVTLSLIISLSVVFLPNIQHYIHRAKIKRTQLQLSALYFQQLAKWEVNKQLPSQIKLEFESNIYALDWQVSEDKIAIHAHRSTGNSPPCKLYFDLESSGLSDNNCNGIYEPSEYW